MKIIVRKIKQLLIFADGFTAFIIYVDEEYQELLHHSSYRSWKEHISRQAVGGYTYPF